MRAMVSTSFGSTSTGEGELAMEAVVPYRISQLCTVDMAPLYILVPVDTDAKQSINEEEFFSLFKQLNYSIGMKHDVQCFPKD